MTPSVSPPPQCPTIRIAPKVATFPELHRQDADAPHPIGLLGACSKRPRRRAAEKRDELATSHCSPERRPHNRLT